MQNTNVDLTELPNLQNSSQSSENTCKHISETSFFIVGKISLGCHQCCLNPVEIFRASWCIQQFRKMAHHLSLAQSARLLVYLVPTYFFQVHYQARQLCQLKKTCFFQTIDLCCSSKSFSIGSQDYYNAIIILLRIQICGGLKDGNIKRIEMPLKQSIFVHQIQMLRGCFQLIIYNQINDTWLPSVMVSSLGSFFFPFL